MCLTIPGKIETIKEGIATVKNGRETAQIDLGLVLDVKPGDWILYATERAVKKISEADAKEIIALLEDNYHPVDVSKLPLRFKKIVYKVRTGDSALTKEDIEYLLKLKGKNNLETLFAEANFLRKDKIKDFICIHGIIEFSNYCKNSCLYCGIRAEGKATRYRLSQEEIVLTAQKAVDDEGYKLLVLQSGEDSFYSDHDLIEIIKAIKAKMRVFILISVGERSAEFYREAQKAGVSGALIRFESSNPELYKTLRPGHKLTDRLNLIKQLIKMGYYIATGSMVGLPGQSLEDIADDLLILQRLGASMVSAGPWLPASGTPLADKGQESIAKTDKEKLEFALKYIAIARFLMPEAKIPVTTALETLDGEEGRHKGMLSGANSLMFNLTPEKYCKQYSIYDNKYREREKVWQKYGLFKDEESWEMLEEKMLGPFRDGCDLNLNN